MMSFVLRVQSQSQIILGWYLSTKLCNVENNTFLYGFEESCILISQRVPVHKNLYSGLWFINFRTTTGLFPFFFNHTFYCLQYTY